MAISIGSEHAFATRTNRLRGSTIREMLKETQRSDVISLAGGLPAPEPLPAVAEATRRVLERDGAASLQYSVSEGIPQLRAWVAARLAARGARVSSDDVLIVGGSQQALDLVARGGTRSAEASLSDAQFSKSDRRAARSRTAREDRRDLRTVPAPLLAHETDCTMLYCGTASKIVAPGLRIAWLVIRDEAVRDKIIPAKQATGLHTGSFAQCVFTELVADASFLSAHIAEIRALYSPRRDVMAAAMHDDMPAGVTFKAPAGGMFFWAKLPTAIDSEQLFVPGRAFYPHRDRGNGVRLNFSNAADDAIRTGIGRLARAIREVGG